MLIEGTLLVAAPFGILDMPGDLAQERAPAKWRLLVAIVGWLGMGAAGSRLEVHQHPVGQFHVGHVVYSGLVSGQIEIALLWFY